MRRDLLFASAAIAALTLSCTPALDSGTQGELGNGNFEYLCAETSDPTCDDGIDQHSLPEAVAMDADIKVLFVPKDLGTDAFVKSASSDFLVEKSSDATGAVFHTEKEGIAAVLAKREDKLVDYAHVKVLEAKTAEVESADGATKGLTTLEIAGGDTKAIRVVPLDVNGSPLAGALACAWTSSDDAVASITGDASDDRVSITGMKGGTATLHVTLGALSADVAVTVTGDAGTGGGGGGGGAGGSGAGGATGAGGAGGGV